MPSWSRAHATISSPGWVPSSLGRRTSIALLFSFELRPAGARLGKRVQRLAREAVHGPLRVRLRPEALVGADRIAIPVENRPFESPAAALDSDPREGREQGLGE